MHLKSYLADFFDSFRNDSSTPVLLRQPITNFSTFCINILAECETDTPNYHVVIKDCTVDLFFFRSIYAEFNKLKCVFFSIGVWENIMQVICNIFVVGEFFQLANVVIRPFFLVPLVFSLHSPNIRNLSKPIPLIKQRSFLLPSICPIQSTNPPSPISILSSSVSI